MAFRWMAACAIAGGVLVCTPDAQAQSAMERETARQLMHEGYALQAKGQHAAALEDFRRAHAIMNVPTTGIEVGRELAALGKVVEARDVLWRVARMKDAPEDPAVYRTAKEEARKLTESLAQRLASLRIVPKGSGYRISVDGTELSEAVIGVSTKVDPGEHVIIVQRDGRRAEVRVSVGEGEVRDVPVEIEGAPAAPPSPAPATPVPDVKESRSTGPSAWFWAGVVGTGAAVVVGGVTGGLALARKSDASQHCQGDRCLPAAQDALDSSRTFASISTAAFITGGVLALATGVLFFIEKGDKKTSAQPFVAKDHAGIVGTF
ncbi:hypothetical protein LZC95_12100 [Pendulispora brunnea]|uniref:Tetratricopeptide repeat protein n=1 Tax=Pendulispora brunnea TaxID=2905690 RepID=A0ABZ2KFV0_9BACT